MSRIRQAASANQGRSPKRRRQARNSVPSSRTRKARATPLTPTDAELAREELEMEREALLENQAQLESSREAYASLYDSAPIGYLTLSKAGCILKINLAGERLLGRTRRQLDRQPLLFFIAKQDRRKYLRHLSLCRQRSGDRLSTELWLNPDENGHATCVDLLSSSAPGPGEDPPAFNSVLMDVTRRKQAEEALRSAHEQLERRVLERTAELTLANQALEDEITERQQTEQALRLSERVLSDFFEQSPFGLLWIGPAGRIQRMNRAALELFGCTPKECLTRSVKTFHEDSKQASEALQRLARREELHNLRAQFRRKDGTLRHVLIDANGLWEEDQMVHSRWFVRDITRRVELEREVLNIAERERQRLGSELHDDLCQQLAGIEFMSQTLSGQLSSQRQGHAERARDIAQLIRQAITHTRELAHGLSPVELETRGLTGALQELAARTRKMFKMDCRFRCRKSGLNHDPALGIHLYRIAQEAVANAIKHGRAKRVEIALTRTRNRLILAVEDNGSGMPGNPGKSNGMGLRLMQYRAGVISGSLVVQRNPKGGTAVVCSVRDVAGPDKKAKANL